jgi:hypothetical protein
VDLQADFGLNFVANWLDYSVLESFVNFFFVIVDGDIWLL